MLRVQFIVGILIPTIASFSAQSPSTPAKTSTSQTTATRPAAIPDSVLYEMTFRRIADQKKIIAKIDSLGKDSTHARSDLKNQMGLTTAEYTAIDAAAGAFVSAHTANLMQLKQLHAALNGGPATASF